MINKFLVIGVVALLIQCCAATPKVVLSPEGAPLQALQESDLHYLGAFLPPQGGNIGARTTFSAGLMAMAYNPANNSLFATAHENGYYIAEISIPSNLNPAINDRANLPEATILQDYVDIKAKMPDTSARGKWKIGGLLVHNNRLISNWYIYYDNNKNQKNFGVLDSLDLKKARGMGLYAPTGGSSGHLGSYMALIPPEWESAFGASALAGMFGVPIGSRTSSGPSIFGFNPDDVGIQDPVPVEPWVDYSSSFPLAARRGTNPLYNALSTKGGMVFVRGSKSVLIWGGHGAYEPPSTVCYGKPEACSSLMGYKGYHATFNQYRHQIWVYDTDEILKMWGGKTPTDIWTFDAQFTGIKKSWKGVAYDMKNNLIYAAANGYYPVIYVFKVNINAGPSPPNLLQLNPAPQED
jgi:hypothetical protein